MVGSDLCSVCAALKSSLVTSRAHGPWNWGPLPWHQQVHPDQQTSANGPSGRRGESGYWFVARQKLERTLETNASTRADSAAPDPIGFLLGVHHVLHLIFCLKLFGLRSGAGMV